MSTVQIAQRGRDSDVQWQHNTVTAAHREWLNQADYDMDTADCMFENGRYFYAAFMCHLSIEKALKALYQFRLQQVPPKTHNLVLLLKAAGIVPPEATGRFLVELNEAHVVTRYPDDLERLKSIYDAASTQRLLRQGKEVLAWTKTQF